MTNDQTIFVCKNCGNEYSKWQGRCDGCGDWNTLKEYKESKLSFSNSNLQNAEISKLSQIKSQNFKRISSQIPEFDRVLGGGIVPGSITIIGGDPGIGKSTLLLQLAAKVENVLYISGEESAEQIKMRFDRLGLRSANLKIYPETNLDAIVEAITKEKPALVIVDSIQTIYSNLFNSTAGSITQVRESASKLQQLAKNTHIAIILIGHVTKDGSVAGPKTLEHIVDTVLYLEGERFHGSRILRAAKNRFGATDEIGIFEMTQNGLVEIKNPSKLFLSEKEINVAGQVITATVEGSRAFLVEVQALTNSTIYGLPQRRTSGFDLNRLQLLLAVLQKRANINISNQDVFVNIVGGIKINEPAVDLAVALAITSSVKGKPIDPNLCVFGEVGLSGEIRHILQENRRKLEAKRLGFSKFINQKTISEVVRRYCV